MILIKIGIFSDSSLSEKQHYERIIDHSVMYNRLIQETLEIYNNQK